MKEAMKEAQKAFDLDEVPVGAVIVCDNRIIARAHNLTERLNDVTAHAEMQAITAAANFLGGKYLKDCSLYVTLEPCVMCAGAIFWAQISKLVYGASDEKRGFTKVDNRIIHPTTKVQSGVMGDISAQLLKEFFRNRR
jgi:tRNA(adenine34) deaminase